jgi:CRISPR/Cas system-associated endonuclease Cas3-HD
LKVSSNKKLAPKNNPIKLIIERLEEYGCNANINLLLNYEKEVIDEENIDEISKLLINHQRNLIKESVSSNENLYIGYTRASNIYKQSKIKKLKKMKGNLQIRKIFSFKM